MVLGKNSKQTGGGLEKGGIEAKQAIKGAEGGSHQGNCEMQNSCHRL